MSFIVTEEEPIVDFRKVESEKKAELEREMRAQKYTLRRKAGPLYTAVYWEIFR